MISSETENILQFEMWKPRQKAIQNQAQKISYRKGDIVFLNDEIFILTINKPIIQLTKSYEDFPGVFYKYSYDTKQKVKERLEIRNSNGSIKVNLNLKNKDFDLENYINGQNIYNN